MFFTESEKQLFMHVCIVKNLKPIYFMYVYNIFKF